MSHLRTCEFCGERAPVVAVCFRQNTGLLVVRRAEQWEGDACRDCGKRLFRKTLIHNMFLGWWGMISMVITPIFLVLNAVSFVKIMRLPTMAALRRDALADQAEYAKNLLRTKDRATVVEVLVRSTGAPPADVERFVGTLEAA